MSLLQAIILGIVQGLTEFLPVSSSGHLQIAKQILNVQIAENLAFDVTLHVATVLSTIVIFRRQVADLLGGLVQFRINRQTEYVFKLLLSMIPIGIVGLTCKDRIDEMLASPAIMLIVGCMLLLTAALLALAYYTRPGTKDNISYRDSLLMGIAQACAAMPGLSRSGSTIATGLLLGNSRQSVAQFSFLMVLAPILGEALLDVIKGDFSSGLGIGAMPLAAGFVAAFATGCLACRLMIEVVKRSKLIYFAAYCCLAGIGSIIWYIL